MRERERRRVYARHVVGAVGVFGPDAVGGDQDLVVRSDAHKRPDLAAGLFDEPEVLEMRGRERSEHLRHRLDGDRSLEHEELDQRRQRPGLVEAALADRNVRRTGQQIARGTERGLDALPAHPRRHQRLPQLGDRAAVVEPERALGVHR